MSLNTHASELFKGFSKLDLKERLSRLATMGALSDLDIEHLLGSSNFSVNLAENFIENVIGYYQMPLGVATNFRIDGKNYVIPMAVEETSIIAAASKTARWVSQEGELTTEIIGSDIVGQIQLHSITDFERFNKIITLNKDYLITLANENVVMGLVARGGGVTDLYTRSLQHENGETMAVIHILMNPCDAMGANLITQVCEYLKTYVEQLTDEHVTMCILSNLNTHKLTRATVIIRNIDKELGQGIEQASRFAETDPYRAATHNKGILNGMDPILLATGNDWRAVEAGVHAYAAKDGQYRSVSQWRMTGNDLIGILEAPISVGTVGGVTSLHPTANMCLRMLGVTSANELSRIVAAVGLVQNLGAITALTTFGFIQGHMRLHIKNLTLNAGATENEIPALMRKLEEHLKLDNRITLSKAIDLLKQLRKGRAKTKELVTQQ